MTNQTEQADQEAPDAVGGQVEWRVRGETMEWQPIETAPKTGKEILFFSGGLIRIGFFDSARAGVWSVWPGRARARASPTHWMPLPEPPNVD